MIKLINGYAITADKRQYILVKQTGVDKDGNPVYSPDSKTYHSTLQHALVSAFRAIGRNQIRKRDYTLKEVYLLMEDIEERLTKAALQIEQADKLDLADYDMNDNKDDGE